MSTPRARRQTEREHEAALRTAARATEEERRERRTARGRPSWRPPRPSKMWLVVLLVVLVLVACWMLAAR